MKKNKNRFKNSFIKFIKENYKLFLFIIIFCTFCFYETPYSIYKPGGTINASKRVSGDNLYTSKGSFNMAYIGYMKGKLPIYLLAHIIPEWELIKNEEFTASETESIDDVLTRDHLSYLESISNATYVAMNNANVPYEITKTNYYITYISPQNDSDLKIGDLLISYDDISFENLDKLREYINSKKENDKILLKYERNKETKETYSTIYKEEDTLYLGVSVSIIYEFSSDYNIKVASKLSESGPSGGFITALSIYNALVEEDITKGYKIVGTGTIGYDGVVGEIGGTNYKLAAAVKDHADIFLCPSGNYEEAIEYAKEKKYDIMIKKVSDFKEALDYLNSLEVK